MTSAAVKITRKGQLTVPKEIRDKLSADTVYFEVKDDVVTIRPVRDAAGSLREFGRNAKRGVSMRQMKEKAWGDAVREKHVKKPA